MGGMHAVRRLFIEGFVGDLILVKAVVQQMPRFGNDIEIVIGGIARLVLIMAMPTQEGSVTGPE